MLRSLRRLLPRRAPDAGHDAVRLAEAYETGADGLPRDPRRAVALYREAGTPAALHRLGILLMRDPQLGDRREAVDAFRRAADAEHPAALYSLHLCLQSGIEGVVEADPAEAQLLLRRAATRGVHQAQYEMASLCFATDDEADHEVGWEWLRRSGRGGNVLAQRVMADSFKTTNPRKHLVWLARAARGGDAAAVFEIALMYRSGKELQGDLRKMVRCLQRASDLGEPRAQFNLGVCHLRGLGGLAKDPETAFTLITRAARSGLPEATAALKRLS